MKTIRVIRLKDQRVIAEKCFEAVRFGDRLWGLMGRSEMSSDEAIWFPNCSSIHTCWMRFAIDVVFLRRSNKQNQAWEVSSIHRGVRPWRIWVGDFKASCVLELAGGAVGDTGLEPGDEVECIG